jgi:hypothetical protein
MAGSGAIYLRMESGRIIIRGSSETEIRRIMFAEEFALNIRRFE